MCPGGWRTCCGPSPSQRPGGNTSARKINGAPSIPLQEASPETYLTPNKPNLEADEFNRSYGQSLSGPRRAHQTGCGSLAQTFWKPPVTRGLGRSRWGQHHFRAPPPKLLLSPPQLSPLLQISPIPPPAKPVQPRPGASRFLAATPVITPFLSLQTTHPARIPAIQDQSLSATEPSLAGLHDLGCLTAGLHFPAKYHPKLAQDPGFCQNLE